MYTLLLIDDDTEVLEINAKYFRKNGYKVGTASNAQAGLQMIYSLQPNCIVLDVMMPGMNGFDACREFRKIVDVPILFLTGRTQENDKINGLMLGGDDYIVKPYSLRELSARILVNIRRHQSTVSSSNQILFPPLRIDLTQHKAYYQEEEILLSNREFELLYLLAKTPNQTNTFQIIGEAMWGRYSDEDRRAIMVNASRLRKKLESYAGLENLIETVWSKGYKLVYNSK